MRSQIANHLNTRCQTIRLAIKALNKAGSELDPPRAPIKYGSVVDMVFVAQFDLLQHSRSGKDIRKEPWADPATRLLTDKYFELTRARKEIQRLNIEWKRVGTWIRDERILYLKVIGHLDSNDPLLAEAVRCKWARAKLIHQTTAKWLSRIRNLPSFSGSVIPGQAIKPEYKNISIPGEKEVEDLNNSLETPTAPGDGQENAHEDLIGTRVGMQGCLDENQQFDDFVHGLQTITSP